MLCFKWMYSEIDVLGHYAYNLVHKETKQVKGYTPGKCIKGQNFQDLN